jgi:predicted PurR-regulated permease PerM
VTLKAVGKRENESEPAERPHAEQAVERDNRPPAAAHVDAPSDTPAPFAIHVPVDVRSMALTVLAVLSLILTLQYAQAMVITIVLGILVSYALDPPVALLARAHIPRPLGAALVLLVVVATASGLLYGLRFEARAIVDQLPAAARRIRHVVESGAPRGANAIKQVQKAANELQKAADAAAQPPPPPDGTVRVQVENPPFAIGDYLVWGSIGAAAAGGQLILILFLVYYLLASGDLYRRKMVKIAGPSLTKKKITLQILSDIDRQIEWFLLVQIFTSTVVGITTWLAYRWIGLEQAAVWGLLAGIFNSIPYFGPVLVTGGTAVVGFLQFGTIRMALVVAATSLVITTLEGFLLTPWLAGRAMRMNAVAVFVGLLFWGWVWNVWGMLLAVPMLMVLKTVCDHVDDFKSIGELLGE